MSSKRSNKGGKMQAYMKCIVAFLTALGTWGATAFADGRLNAVEAFGLTGVFVAGFAVYQVTNTPQRRSGKG